MQWPFRESTHWAVLATEACFDWSQAEEVFFPTCYLSSSDIETRNFSELAQMCLYLRFANCTVLVIMTASVPPTWDWRRKGAEEWRRGELWARMSPTF